MTSPHKPLTLFFSFLFVLGLVVLGSCARPAMMPGSSDRGYIVYGYVNTDAENTAEDETVYLFDDGTGTLVSTVKTDTFGKYAFAYHKPGRYRVEALEPSRVVVIIDGDIQVDLMLQ